MIIFYQIILFLKKFLEWNVCFGLLTELKRSLRLAFDAHSLHDFSIKIFLIYYSINSQSFNVIPFFLLKISNKNCYHSHKKWKDILEGSLDRVLFAAELEFLKILVPRLNQHTSNVNIECARKSEWSKQLYSLYLTSFLVHWHILILLF